MPSVVHTVQTESILKELGTLWRDLSEPKPDDPKSTAVLRACSMTLIVVSDDPNDASQVSETVAALMHEHPSRAIVLRLAGESAPLEARVFAQCWMPFGSREQICCEQIEISAGRNQMAEAPPVITGLTVPDLPVVVFCRQPNLLELHELDRLWPLADKVVTDSAAKTGQQMANLEKFTRQTARVADLAWTRLTPWREAVARVFDNPQQLELLRTYRTLTVGYAGETTPVAASYLSAWFRRILGGDIEVKMISAGPAGDAPIRFIRLEGGSAHVQLTLNGKDSVEIETGSQRTIAPLRPASEHLLLREELSILGADPLFDAVLAAAEKAQ